MSDRTPLRRCVGCGQSFDPADMIRIKRSKDGSVKAFADGSFPGRSAYICRNISCVRLAEKKRGLERSFKAPVDKVIYKKLTEVTDTDES